VTYLHVPFVAPEDSRRTKVSNGLSPRIRAHIGAADDAQCQEVQLQLCVGFPACPWSVNSLYPHMSGHLGDRRRIYFHAVDVGVFGVLKKAVLVESVFVAVDGCVRTIFSVVPR
jgi:hypothetical protein